MLTGPSEFARRGMIRRIALAHAPALGDIRTMGAGDTVWVDPDATRRPDWPRYLDAIGIAVTRGADVRHVQR